MDNPKKTKNLYQILIDDLLAKIQNEEFSYDLPFCTERQLCQDYKVSNITAKRAIKELEQQGILYRKRGVGSFVSRQTPHSSQPTVMPPTRNGASVFAFVSPFIMSPNSIFAEMIQRINGQLNPHMGFVSPLVTSRVGRDLRRERETLWNLLEQGISGLLFYPQTNLVHLEILWQLAARGLPVIILNKTESTPYLHNVICDNYGGQKALCQQLIAHGHKKMAYLASPAADDNTSVAERLGGFLAAIHEAGLSVAAQHVRFDLDKDIVTSLITATPPKLQRIHDTVRFLLANGVTAIQCDNDGLAYYVIQYCIQNGIRVPQQISVTGFDSGSEGIAPDLHIDSVFQDFFAIAKEAGQIFLDHIQGKPQCIRKTVIPAPVVSGKTMGANPLR